jgi:hypothetical protein
MRQQIKDFHRQAMLRSAPNRKTFEFLTSVKSRSALLKIERSCQSSRPCEYMARASSLHRPDVNWSHDATGFRCELNRPESIPIHSELVFGTTERSARVPAV